jgi:TolB-like protein
MKKNLLFFMLALAAGCAAAQQTVTLDAAIADAAKAIDNRLSAGSKIVVLNFNSPSERLSNYIIDELTGAIVNSGKLTAVDRQNLALIQQEMNFQMSGEVSDTSAQEIGMKLGAQSIISGSIEDMNTYYRIRFRAIEVVSAAIQVQASLNVRKDDTIAGLLGGSGFSGGRAAASPTSYPNGLNFSTNRKIGAGFLNWIYGIGSFTMGDWVGGIIVGGAQLVGTVVFVAGALYEKTETTSESGYSREETTYGSVPAMLIGGGISLGGAIYGHIRPFQYDKALAQKNGTYIAYNKTPWKDNPLEHVNVALLPTRSGTGAVRLSYSLQF